jgi:hypothetical protein
MIPIIEFLATIHSALAQVAMRIEVRLKREKELSTAYRIILKTL